MKMNWILFTLAQAGFAFGLILSIIQENIPPGPFLMLFALGIMVMAIGGQFFQELEAKENAEKQQGDEPTTP